jgi:hypothetical protein
MKNSSTMWRISLQLYLTPTALPPLLHRHRRVSNIELTSDRDICRRDGLSDFLCQRNARRSFTALQDFPCSTTVAQDEHERISTNAFHTSIILPSRNNPPYHIPRVHHESFNQAHPPPPPNVVPLRPQGPALRARDAMGLGIIPQLP